MKLSKRLTCCVTYTKGFEKLADIGTDHAFLPIHAVLEGYVSSALAIDNKKGPFAIAQKSVSNQDLNHKIKVLLSSGLEDIDDDVDVVVISGMGGLLISDILKSHSIRNVKRIILQANKEGYLARKALLDIGFQIVDEQIIHEGKKCYEIVVAEVGKASYTEKELVFGPINLRHKTKDFIKKLEHDLEQLNRLLLEIPTEVRQLEIQKEIKLIEEVLA